MEEYLNMPIKELITKFPRIGELLEQYNIGCVPCNVGSCLFKDIMEIHNLPEKDEQALMARIADVLYPGKKVSIPRIERKRQAASGEIKYSPPIKKLVDEHVVIKKLVALIPVILENLDVESEKGRKIIEKSVDFIRFYADKYHHAKEEEILFTYFDGNLDILKVMREDHENARAHVRAVLGGLEKRDKDAIREHLEAYQELLKEHIKKEDEILYPWMDRNLTVAQVGELFSKFAKVDETGDREVIEGCRKFVENLDERFRNSKKTEVAQ